MHDEIRTSTNLISQLNALIAELEASGDYEEVFDLVMQLRDDKCDEQDKVVDFNRFIAVAEEKIHGKEIDLEMLEAEGNDVAVGCAIGVLVFLAVVELMDGIGIMETQAIDDQDPLVNYDNDNENDDLGYQSEEYFDKVQEDYKNNHSNRNIVKRGITRREFESLTYILPNQNTLSKLNEVPAKYSSILQSEEWVNFVKYTATEEYKVKSAAAKMARSKSVYQHTMGRGGYALVKEKMIEKKEIEPDEEPARGTLWLKGRVNKDGEYPDDEIRSVGDKLKETEDKIKEGTLKVDHGTDAMTVVLGKEKGGYARGVGSGVTYKRYFDLPRSRQASDERILLLQSQLDNERRERQEKELLIQNLSNKMSQTEGMVTKLKNQLAAQGGMSPVDIYLINSSADEEGGTTVVRCENDASIQKSNGLATLEKEMETRTDGKKMLHNKELPKDCYKVSIDTSLVDAACIPDVGNNSFKTVKDAMGSFFAWPKDLVVFDPKCEIKRLTTKDFCPTTEIQRMEHELLNLKVKDSNITAYT
ncbi:transposase, Ptta/En/Spm, transposase, Tnp1/En/Spm-like protein [Tanacetum coccineum]